MSSRGPFSPDGPPERGADDAPMVRAYATVLLMELVVLLALWGVSWYFR
jgi:hypothetical protein